MFDGTPTEELQLAAIALPIFAAIVGVAVNSINDDDSVRYRVIVTGLGLGAFIPAIIFFSLTILSSGFDVDGLNILFYMMASVLLISLMVLIVVFKEALRGLEEREKRDRVKTWSLIIVLVITVLLHILNP